MRIWWLSGRAKCLLLLLIGCFWAGGVQAALPFVGCPADGMSGPVPAPSAVPVLPRVPAASERQLAYYAEGSELAVLAPRGWHCIELYGSGGAFMLVTPRRYATNTLPDFNRLAGPAVELSFLSGENSGRDQVAEVFLRLFPSKRRFVRNVAEGYDYVRHYATGPYLTDRTVRRGRAEVDYTTPPGRKGMGTYGSRLGPGASPIVGAAILAHSNGIDSVVLLNVRLPHGQRALAPVILDAARRAWARQAQ